MTRTRKIIVTTLLAAGVTLGAGSAFAYRGDCGGADGTRAESVQKRMEERHQARLEQLHKDLKLTTAQEGAWKTFTENSGPKNMQRPDREAMGKMTAPERMEQMLTFSKAHQAVMEERLAATKKFYSALTAEQKTVFDQHFSGPRGGKDGKGRHGRGPNGKGSEAMGPQASR